MSPQDMEIARMLLDSLMATAAALDRIMNPEQPEADVRPLKKSATRTLGGPPITGEGA